MIVGTAGHIDHGKTTLVHALTGVDTDRLPEEKARGISIDLGYAYTPTDGGDVLGFVDVPGHDKFIHTMLAGATGIDFALLVVAADDGVMPQTREHLNILELLGIPDGAIVVTKIDAVESSRVADVERELRALVARGRFAHAPLFAVSGRTGAGVEALRRHLETCAAKRELADTDGEFRLAVDRSFTLPGIGTVVTGTVHAGCIAHGAPVTIAPNGRAARVRGIHAQNRPSETAVRGQRCALNLAGVARAEVARGDWVVAPSIALDTDRFDASFELLPGEAGALVSGTTVHVHVGAAHTTGRIVVLDPGATPGSPTESLAPGVRGVVQVVVRSRIAAWRGDRYIVRDAAASRTMGGGVVLDPLAPARYRKTRERLAVLAAHAIEPVSARLARLVETAPHGVDLRRFARTNGLREIDTLANGLAGRRVANESLDFALAGDRWQALQAEATAAFAAFHHAHPDELGPDSARFKRIAFPRLDAMLYRALIADLVDARTLARSGPWLHLAGHTSAPSPQERTLVDRVLPRLLDTPFDPPWVRDVAKAIAQPEPQVRVALIRAAKRGETYQVVRDLFYHPAAIRDLAGIARDLGDAVGEVRAADFRDRTGLGRKRAIQILEFFDRVGFTRRLHDAHVVRGDALLTVGDPTLATCRTSAESVHVS